MPATATKPTAQGTVENDNSYLVKHEDRQYRIYQRADGRWGFVGHGVTSGLLGFATSDLARKRAIEVYGF